MATVTHRVSSYGTPNTATYTTGPFNVAQNDLIIFLAFVSGTTATGSATASANGITFTKITSAVRGGSVDTLYAFVSDQLVGASPSSMTCTVDVTSDPGTGVVMCVASVSGMTNVGSAAIRQFATHDNYAAGIPNVTFDRAPLTANAELVFVANAAIGGAAMSPPSSFTEGADEGYATPDRGAEYAYRNSGGTRQNISWGSSSGTATGALGIELDTSSGPDPSPGLNPFVVDATHASTGDTSGTSCSPEMPTGWLPNDVLLLIAAATPSSNTFTKPSDYTQIRDVTSGNCRFYVAYKVAVEGDTSPTVSISVNNLQTGLLAIRNLDTLNLFGASEATQGGTAGSTVTFPDVSPRNANDFLVRIAATRVVTAGAVREHTSNPDGGTGGTVVRVADVQTTQLSAGNTGIAVWVQNLSATTAPGADTSSVTISTVDWRGESIAFKSVDREFMGAIPI